MSDEFDVTQLEHIGIIGNGNIACDVSRMLLKDVNLFKDSDTPQHVLESLSRSNIHTIEMTARRGITQAAFTTKEIREICALEDLDLYMVQQEYEDSMTDASNTELLVKKIARRTQLLIDQATMIESPEHYLDVISKKNEKKLILRFLRNPVKFIPSETD